MSVYVDNLVILVSMKDGVKLVADKLMFLLMLKELEKIMCFLGLTFEKAEIVMCLHQAGHYRHLIECFRMQK